MLRLAVLLLLLANAGYYAWSAGLLQTWGLAPASDAEPERLTHQLEPERLRLLEVARPPEPAASAPGRALPFSGPQAAAPQAPDSGARFAASPATAAAPVASTADTAPAPQMAPQTAARPAGVCLQAGILDARQGDALRAALAAWPEGSWTLAPTPIAGRWMVYMGRLADDGAVAKKRAELRSLGVDYDRPGAAFEPGLSLGRFSTEESAQRALSQLGRQGVRSARVVQERPEATGHTLRLPAVDDALRQRLPALQPALAGRALRPCG